MFFVYAHVSLRQVASVVECKCFYRDWGCYQNHVATPTRCWHQRQVMSGTDQLLTVAEHFKPIFEKTIEVAVWRVFFPPTSVSTLRGSYSKSLDRCLIRVLQIPACKFLHTMALESCPCAFRLCRLAQSVGHGLGIGHTPPIIILNILVLLLLLLPPPQNHHCQHHHPIFCNIIILHLIFRNLTTFLFSSSTSSPSA